MSAGDRPAAVALLYGVAFFVGRATWMRRTSPPTTAPLLEEVGAG